MSHMRGHAAAPIRILMLATLLGGLVVVAGCRTLEGPVPEPTVIGIGDDAPTPTAMPGVIATATPAAEPANDEDYPPPAAPTPPPDDAGYPEPLPLEEPEVEGYPVD